MWIHQLSSVLQEAEVGAKASSLARLIRAGVAVPFGVALDKSLLIEYRKNGSLPSGFLSNLENTLEDFNSAQIIVRSSAVGEDSDSHSFAGQLDSIVVNNNIANIEKAIYECWDGLNNDRVKAYEKFSGIRLEQMGVVIQEFLDADYAGVTFTQSPINPDFAYTEYVKGAGEQLVSGKTTPKNFSFKKELAIADEIPFNARKLAKYSYKLQEEFNCHLDIEWVAKDDEIYFVQARPITVKATSKVHWTNTNLNENYPDPISPLLYSIARDSYYHYFKNLSRLLSIDENTIRTLEYDFSNTVGIWGNRIYYNMTSIHNVMSSSVLQRYFKTAFNQFVGYSEENVASVDSKGRTSLLKLIWRLIILNFRLEKHVSNIEEKVSSFSDKVDKSSSLRDNSKLYYEFLDLRFHQWYRASLADFFSMIHYKLLGKLTQRFYGKESIGVHNTLIQAIPGLISSEPLVETWKLVEHISTIEGGRTFFLNNSPSTILTGLQDDSKWKSTKIMVEDYLKKWGFRCSGELMFFKKNYIEEPDKFIELLQSYMKNQAVNPEEVIALKDLERRKAMRSFAVRILKKRHILLPVSLIEIALLYLVARLCKNAISSRERVRYKQAEMYYKFKVVLNKISAEGIKKGIFSKIEDILYLSYKEIGEILSSSTMGSEAVPEVLKERIVHFQQESKNVFPNNFSTDFGKRPVSIVAEIENLNGSKEFTGLAASGGRIKARVKVLESVLEGEKLNKGDILVTKQTDPGWAMVFPIIGGLIVERGGALSHGAIVAREFGIPAVIGIDRVTELLKDDDLVILDGDLGKIQILEE